MDGAYIEVLLLFAIAAIASIQNNGRTEKKMQDYFGLIGDEWCIKPK